MRKIIYLFLAILFAIAVWFLYEKNFSKKEIVYSIDTQKEEIILYRETGEVSIKEPSSDLIKLVTENSLKIENNTSVLTGTSSRASVLMPDNSVISLSENTEIKISYTATNTSIFQSLGSTYHRVEALVSGKTYEVKTPSTLAAVRGTKFAVIYNPKEAKTKIAVTESKVAVSRIKKLEGVQGEIIESSILVESGNTANVPVFNPKETRRNSKVEVESNSFDKKVESWIKENQVLDEKIDEIKKNKDTVNVDMSKFLKENIDRVLIEKTKSPTEESSFQDTINDRGVINLETQPSVKETEIRTTEATKITNVVTTSNEPEVVTTQKIETSEVKVGTVSTDTSGSVLNTSAVVSPFKKYDSEEEYYTVFDALLIKYFYADDENFICNISTSPSVKVDNMVGLANANGQSVAKDGLLNLANNIKTYCTSLRDPREQIKLQADFDIVVSSL